MAHTPPNGDAVLLALSGTPYTPKAGDAVDLLFYSGNIGTGAFTVDFTVEGSGTFTSVLIVAEGAFSVDPLADVAGEGRHGERGQGAVDVQVDIAGDARHGVRGGGDVAFTFAPAGNGTVVRYELLGEIRKDTILVNRLVRVYRRDTGELIAEAMSDAGHFRIHTGFVEREHYIVPIDTANDAVDWSPPVANRVLSVLAMDAA